MLYLYFHVKINTKTICIYKTVMSKLLNNIFNNTFYSLFIVFVIIFYCYNAYNDEKNFYFLCTSIFFCINMKKMIYAKFYHTAEISSVNEVYFYLFKLYLFTE